MRSSATSSLIHFLLSVVPLFFLSTSEQTIPEGISLKNQGITFVESSQNGCGRVHIMGTSRLNLTSYANSLHITLKSSDVMPEKFDDKVAVCFHRNASVDPCQLDSCEWRSLQKGQLKTLMSPYANRYVDVKFKDKASRSIMVTAKEEFQRWRLVCLGVGIILWFLAPVVSNWVPFYYSSSMALGVLLVVLLILFQGMKLLPMGRKSALYLTFYGSLLGIGSYIAHYFSTVVNSILEGFGLSEEMHNPVSVFLLLGLGLAGAALGYWTVRKYILSEDGRIDTGTAHFVKWAMRMIAGVSIFLSSLDSILAMVALIICSSACYVLTSKIGRSSPKSHRKNENMWKQKEKQASLIGKRAEFLGRSGTNVARDVSVSSSSPYALSKLQMQVNSNWTPNKPAPAQDEDFYSSFHTTPRPRKYTKKQWEDFTRESTTEALEDWAATPEVAKWVAENAHRIHLDKNDSDDNLESSSGSSEEAVENDNSRGGIFKWY